VLQTECYLSGVEAHTFLWEAERARLHVVEMVFQVATVHERQHEIQ
jgi:hypothetical protein